MCKTMKWADTVASNCRYANIAEEIFGEAEIIAERSDDGYQGYVNVLAKLPDGRYCHYEYSYGSCSGCDTWEATEATGEQILAEMKRDAVYFDSLNELDAYFAIVVASDDYWGSDVGPAAIKAQYEAWRKDVKEASDEDRA